MLTKLTTAAAAAIFMTGAAFAQTSALNPEPFPMPTDMDSEVGSIFADDDGNMRMFDDFSMRYSAASEEQRAEVKRICEDYATSDTVTSLRVKNRCLGVIDQ
ncbi:hypothetical protein [Oricola cellulosilytica]|uniref:UrcA family protein n=1 Tax=Oricola cellulosilytica TaxID=1429082 RepID=A0A4R0PI13_9HYPH|nr:hypothetical protein [Oricola cellulosilytica]TCD16394.1 hypothetical protein E0D97_02915 [Oricola cellulosilytica]